MTIEAGWLCVSSTVLSLARGACQAAVRDVQDAEVITNAHVRRALPSWFGLITRVCQKQRSVLSLALLRRGDAKAQSRQSG